MRAKAVNPRKKGQITKTESAFLQSDWLLARFNCIRYESHTLRFGDQRYTPDVTAVRAEDGQVCHIEVKPSLARAVYTDYAKSKLKTFATEYQEYVFYLATPDKGAPNGWRIEEIATRCQTD